MTAHASIFFYPAGSRHRCTGTRLHLHVVNCIDDIMVPDDSTLVQNVLNGDRRSFDELAARHIPRIFRLVYRFFSNRHQAEDIVQDILLQAYQSLGTYGRERPFTGWLTAIAVRRCYRELRLRAQRSEVDLPELSGLEQDSLDQCCLCAGSRTANTEAALIARDITARMLAQLPAREQLVLILREVEGLSLMETAGMLGISRLHVKVVSHRARKHAQKVLAAMACRHERQTHSQEHAP